MSSTSFPVSDTNIAIMYKIAQLALARKTTLVLMSMVLIDLKKHEFLIKVEQKTDFIQRALQARCHQ
jgi:hypothetical protein